MPTSSPHGFNLFILLTIYPNALRTIDHRVGVLSGYCEFLVLTSFRAKELTAPCHPSRTSGSLGGS